MAFTFPELFDGLPPIPNPALLAYYVYFNLMIVQEDGNTAWAGLSNQNRPNPPDWEEPIMTALPAARRVVCGLGGDVRGEPSFAMSFARRNHFDVTQDDQWQALITESDSGINCHFRLLRWKTEYDVHLDLVPDFEDNGKIYQGFGPTIGGGSGKAVHTLCFVDRIVGTLLL